MPQKKKKPSAGGGGKQPQPGKPPAAPTSAGYGGIGLVLASVGLLVAFFAGPASKTGSTSKQPSNSKPPPICPNDWRECPKQPGVDWVKLSQLEGAALSGLSAEVIERCLGPTPLLSEREVPGMHLLCVLPPPSGEEHHVAATLAVFRNMLLQPQPTAAVLLPDLSSSDDVVATLAYRLGFPRKGPRYQRPALFTEKGVRLVRAAAALGKHANVHRLLCLEGGQWLWPPVEVGHVHVLPNLTAPGVDTRVVPLSFKPLVVEVENFLTGGEAAHIIGCAACRPGVVLR